MSFWDYLFGEETPPEYFDQHGPPTRGGHRLSNAERALAGEYMFKREDFDQPPQIENDPNSGANIINDFLSRDPKDLIARSADELGIIGAPDDLPVDQEVAVLPPGSLPSEGPITLPRPQIEGGPTPIANVPPEPAPDDEMRKFFEMYDEYFPQREPVPEQTEAENYARDEMSRAKKLAQLRFFGHVAQAGGPGWENVGQGFLAYADTMDTGHQRFLKTLDQAAAKDQAVTDQQYNDQVQRTATAFDLYNNAQRSKIARGKEARLARKDKIDRIDKYFKSLFDNAGGDFGIEPSIREKLEKRWRRSRDVGEIIDDFDDVRS